MFLPWTVTSLLIIRCFSETARHILATIVESIEREESAQQLPTSHSKLLNGNPSFLCHPCTTASSPFVNSAR